MAEILGEFDAPSPSPKSFCTRISEAQYERQSTITTEIALMELLDHLNYNPTAFFDVVLKRRKEEEQTGLMSYMKTKLYAWLYGQNEMENLSSQDGIEKLRIFKEDLIKSYNYGQEAKGSHRRFSHRLAEKKWHKVGDSAMRNQNSNKKTNNTSKSSESPETLSTPVRFSIPSKLSTNEEEHNTLSAMVSEDLKLPRVSTIRHCVDKLPPPPLQSPRAPPPPPPLPPPQPALHFNQQDNVTSFKGSDQQNKENYTGLSVQELCVRKQMLKPSLKDPKSKTKSNALNDFTAIVQSIKNPNVRKVLKPVQKNENEFLTPGQLHKKRKLTEKTNDDFTMFNQELVRKFKLAHGSPLLNSPLSDHGFTP